MTGRKEGIGEVGIPYCARCFDKGLHSWVLATPRVPIRGLCWGLKGQKQTL